MNKLLIITLSFLLTGCSYSVTIVNAEGYDVEVIDETPSNTASISIIPVE